MAKHEKCEIYLDGHNNKRIRYCDSLKEALDSNQNILAHKLYQLEKGIYMLAGKKHLFFTYCPFCGFDFNQTMKPAKMSMEEWLIVRKTFLGI